MNEMLNHTHTRIVLARTDTNPRELGQIVVLVCCPSLIQFKTVPTFSVLDSARVSLSMSC